MSQRRILVIEDDDSIRELMQIVLMDEDYLVMAKPLMVQLSKDDLLPDLIILDNILRGQLGHDICLALKKDPLTSSIPIILMSASNNLIETAESCKADAFINKPFDIDELASCVKLLLS